MRERIAFSFKSVFFIGLILVQAVVANQGYHRTYGEQRDWKKELEEKVYDLEYEEYLDKVFRILQQDEYFYGKMMQEYRKEGKTGVKMVDHLNKLPRELRLKLNELKMGELARLKKYAEQLREYGFSEERIQAHVSHASMHLDTASTYKFTPKDLRLLIRETTEHLRVIDDIKQEHFKEYEMHKRLELEELKKRLNPQQQGEIDEMVMKLREARKKSKPMHMPLSKPHVLEIWEGEDGMERGDFNLKTFFEKHDLDGNENWDEKELTLLLNKEISRFYHPDDEDFDQKEKDEEMRRMKDHVYNEVDTNKDGNIDLPEFYKYVKWMDMSEYDAWTSLLDQPIFTQKEYDEYSMRHRAEVNKMIDEGKISLPRSGIVKRYEEDLKAKEEEKKSEEKKVVKEAERKPIKMKPVEKEL